MKAKKERNADLINLTIPTVQNVLSINLIIRKGKIGVTIGKGIAMVQRGKADLNVNLISPAQTTVHFVTVPSVLLINLISKSVKIGIGIWTATIAKPI